MIRPYPYQEEGIQKGLRLKRFINGDDMGLGKTMQAIITVERAKATPCLVICPSSLKINWEREVRKFTSLRPLVLTDAVKSTFPYYIGTMDMYDVCIVNYESLRKYFVVEAKKGFKLKDVVFQPVIRQFKSVILDESHRVKDPSAQQTKFTKGICGGKEYVIELTGTPVVNDPADLATQIAILGRMKEFGGYGKFMQDYKADGDLEELNKKIHECCYFRREKRTVLEDLPDLTRTTLVTEILPVGIREEYDCCKKELLRYLQEYKGCTEGEARRKMRMQALVKFMNLRSIAGRGKLDAAIQFLKDTDKQCVVFCEHKEIVASVKKVFKDAVTVTGDDSPARKQFAIDAFQRGERKIIVCSIKAAGVGLTLTSASDELFVELPWTFADLSQCEARCHRIGQKNAVNSWILIGKDSIDYRLYGLIMDKKSVAARITGSVDDALKDERYFNELMSCVN